MAPCRSAVSLAPMASRTSCSAAAHSGSARLNRARPAGGRHQLVTSLVARLGALDQPVLQQRAEVARQRRAVGGQQVGQLADRHRALGRDEAQQRELRDLQAGRRQMLAVDLGHAPRRAADAKAGAVEGRQAGAGHGGRL